MINQRSSPRFASLAGLFCRIFICLLLSIALPGLSYAAAEADGYLTTADGLRLFYRQLGSGPKGVLVPNGHYLIKDFAQLADSEHTFIFYDLRNRGRSDAVKDSASTSGGIQQEVEDLEAVRRHFHMDKAAIIGHSFVGLVALLYAMEYPQHVDRIVQIDSVAPPTNRKYPPNLVRTDRALNEAITKNIAAFAKKAAGMTQEQACRGFWDIIRVYYVTDAKDAVKLDDYCQYPNEWNWGRYFSANIQPSIQSLQLTNAQLAKVVMPVLVIHGTADRVSPYGAGREWALLLPGARLLTIKDGSHYPWIEAPARVFGSIHDFLNGGWPKDAEKVTRIAP